MLDPLPYIYLLFLLGYVGLLLFLKKAWFQLLVVEKNPEGNPLFSLLVPFRNESDHLPGLMENLDRLVPVQSQVIFVNDHSQDGSLELVQHFIQHSKRQHWVCINSQKTGKKGALSEGIWNSHHDLIITTDADVTLSENWIPNLLFPFSDPKVQLVAGPVLVNEAPGFFSDFQLIEWASLILVTGATFSKGSPVMCSGANLAFRKSAFYTVGGYHGNEQILSGDDEFMLKKIHAHFGRDALRYVVDRKVLVETFALDGPGEWINQRARWAGKWHLHGWNGHAFAAVGLALASGIHLSVFPLTIFSFKYVFIFVVYVLGKAAIEWFVLGAILAVYNRQRSFVSYIKASILHPVMVLCTLPFAIFSVFSWKGRKH